MKLTDEQQEIFNEVERVVTSSYETNVVIHIDAKAGCGKRKLLFGSKYR